MSNIFDPAIEVHFYLLAIALVLLETSLMLAFFSKRNIPKKQMCSILILSAYVFLVFSSTVFSRETKEDFTYELEIFWSYRRAFEDLGSRWLLLENFLNLLLLLPEGFLLPVAGMREGRTLGLHWVTLIGFGTSVCIEVMQLAAKRGLFEYDDMIHNTLGVVLGYFLWWLISRQLYGDSEKKRN